MDVIAKALSDTGRVRDQNEDTYLIDLPLIAVADGMGGHQAGEIASQLAVQELASWKVRLADGDLDEIRSTFREAFTKINRAVFEKGQEDESLSGMGTTLTAAWIDDDNVVLAHVGDSRAYLMRRGRLEQLTEDQNVAQELVRRGRLSQKEAASSPHRHVMLQAIGAERDDLDVETLSVPLRPGDRLVLSSDGLHGMLRDNERLRTILTEHPDPDKACSALVEAANAAGGEDNITVVIVDVPGEAAAASDEFDHVIVDRGSAKRSAETPRRRFPRQALVIGGAVLLVALMAALFVLRPGGDSYVLAAQGREVVVLRGQPGEGATGRAKGEVVRVLENWETSDFPAPTQRQLRTGIEVDSIADAERRARLLPKTLAANETPTPRPTERGSPAPTRRPATTPARTPARTP